MVIYLIVLAILAFAFLVMMFFNYRRDTRSGMPEKFRVLRIIASWVLLFTFIGSIGGAVYAASHPTKKSTAKVVKKSDDKSSASSLNDKLGVTFSKENPTLGEDGKVTVKLYVSSKTSVKIIGHNSQTVYKTFAASSKNKTQTFSFTFTDVGTYDVELSRGATSMNKSITIKGAESSSSSDEVTSEESSQTTTGTVSSGGSTTGASGGGYVYSGGTGGGGTDDTVNDDNGSGNSGSNTVASSSVDTSSIVGEGNQR